MDVSYKVTSIALPEFGGCFKQLRFTLTIKPITNIYINCSDRNLVLKQEQKEDDLGIYNFSLYYPNPDVTMETIRQMYEYMTSKDHEKHKIFNVNGFGLGSLSNKLQKTFMFIGIQGEYISFEIWFMNELLSQKIIHITPSIVNIFEQIIKHIDDYDRNYKPCLFKKDEMIIVLSQHPPKGNRLCSYTIIDRDGTRTKHTYKTENNEVTYNMDILCTVIPHNTIKTLDINALISNNRLNISFIVLEPITYELTKINNTEFTIHRNKTKIGTFEIDDLITLKNNLQN